MATKTNPPHDPTDRNHLLTLLESKTVHLADKYRRLHTQLVTLRQEHEKLLDEQKKLKETIRELEQKLYARGDTTAVAPVLELRQEVEEMIGIVDNCLNTLEKGIR